jgi:putative hydrolase
LASGHAFNTLDELARAAAAAGLEVLGVTDHGPSMTGAPTHGYFEMAHRVPQILHGVHVLVGCEANIIDHRGGIDIDDAWAPAQGVLLAGLHARSGYDTASTTAQNTEAVVAAIQNPSVHIISHPYRERLPVETGPVADAASACGTLLEVNLSMFKTLLASEIEIDSHPVVCATRKMLASLLHQGGHFILNSDAHHASEIESNHAAADRVCDLLDIPLTMAVNYNDCLANHLPHLQSAPLQG